jgi:biotin operon repressor
MPLSEDHPIANELETIVARHISDGDKAGKIADEVLKLLDREKLLYYSDPGRVPVMNSNGRVLLAILEDPGITQRALAVYLRMSESAVQKCVRALLKDGVIVKKMKGKRNHYEFNKQKGMSHPDVSRLLGTLLPLLSGS